MEELGLEHILNPNQLRKKWNYLVAKYKVKERLNGCHIVIASGSGFMIKMRLLCHPFIIQCDMATNMNSI